MDTFLLERGPLSRGSFIITQKENKGEYDGGWEWNNTTYDWDIYAHTFDQNGPSGGNGIPYQYSTNISDWSQPSAYWTNPSAIPRCTPITASGNLTFSTQNPYTDKACVANTHNAGNYYNFPAATAGSDNKNTSTTTNMSNSICPKGWRLPPSSNNKSYQNLIRDTYQIANGPSGSIDSTLLANSAMSFVRLGRYAYDYGSLNLRGYGSYYWSSTAYNSVSSRYLSFNSGNLNPQGGSDRAYGYSVRCVSH